VHPTENQGSIGHQGMDIKTLANSHLHCIEHGEPYSKKDAQQFAQNGWQQS
jgi:hypothetical protein